MSEYDFEEEEERAFAGWHARIEAALATETQEQRRTRIEIISQALLKQQSKIAAAAACSRELLYKMRGRTAALHDRT